MDKKLSFSFASKSTSSKPSRSSLKNPKTFADNEAHGSDDGASQQFITEFDPSKKADASARNRKLVIAPIENEYRPGKRMKNLDLPLRSSARSEGDLSFEVDDSADMAADGAGAKMAYGLNVRKSGKEGGGGGYRDVEDGQRKEPIDSLLLKKLKDDIDRLPEDEGFDQFEEVPVEGFGAALMAGYGWKEGMGIGKNAKQDVEVIKYKRWAGREGLGAFSDMDDNRKKVDAVVAGRRDGVTDMDKRENSGFSIGKDVRVTGGRHMGLKGKVVEDSSSNGLLILELSGSREQIRVSVADVAELGSSDEERCLKKLEELKLKGSKADRKEKDSAGNRSDKERKEIKRGREERRRDDPGYVKRDSMKREERVNRVSWLRSHIRVRIICKDFKGGRLYLKKGEILDVVGPTVCDISMDGSREIIQGVEQSVLETALPRRGGPVVVLLGKHKGAYGILVKKDVETETAVVEEADSREMMSVGLDQIAEYTGDPSDLGY